MGQITVEKRVANQGHSLAVNITKECHAYGIQKGDKVSVTINHDLIPETRTAPQTDENNSE